MSDLLSLNDKQALYFLWVTILNQSQKADVVLEKTLNLFERLGIKENFNKFYPLLTYEKIISAVTQKPAIHRFPKNMSENLFLSIENIKKNYSNKPCLLFQNFSELKEIKQRLLKFRGIGKHKADVAIIIFENFFRISDSINNRNNCDTLFLTLDKELSIINSLKG